MKLNPEAGCQFPTFYFLEKTANRTIDKYLKQIFELTTTDWEIYLAPLMFSYNTSFNRTFLTSPHFVIFGQYAKQPAFNHGNCKKKHLGESPAVEKYQTLQATRQVAWQNVAHQQQMNFKIYEYQSASHEFKPEQWVLLKDNRNQWGGPLKIVKLKPHNTVDIKTGLKTNILVHIKNLKPYHGDSTFKNFSNHYQKQGGGANYFDCSDNEEEKLEKSNMKDRRNRQQPNEQDKDQMEHEVSNSDLEEEDCQITFPTRGEMKRQYLVTKPSQNHEDQTETEIEIEEEEDTLPHEEPIREKGLPEDQWITSKLRKNVEKRIRILEQPQIIFRRKPAI
jgi:hypothetical protein